MRASKYPVYIVIQDASEEDWRVLNKYEELITEVIHTENQGRDVEDLINRNRFLAWELPLLHRNHKYVVCLEDDVEVSEDIFEFTEKVLEQNTGLKNFWGINYGSFEKPTQLGTYSKLRYGMHGPASLISRESLRLFRLGILKKLQGRIPWDSWVEPKVKTGYVVTSNVSRYRDNGHNGTHAKIEQHSNYFEKINASFISHMPSLQCEYFHKDIKHSWRNDCLIYSDDQCFRWNLKFIAIRSYQLFKALAKIAKGLN